MKINIYYRHAEGCKEGAFRPEGFSFERCFKSLLKSIEGCEDVNLNLAFDGHIEKDFIYNYKSKFNTILQTNYKDSLKSFLYLLDNIESQDMEDAEIIYYIENDYLHLPGWVDKVKTLFNTYKGIDYVSLYDHNDKYIDPKYDDLVSKIIVTKDSHWRTSPSSCGTYMMERSTWDKDLDIWKEATGDHETFIKLNQDRGGCIFTPIPGLSSHCMKHLESPLIDWRKI